MWEKFKEWLSDVGQFLKRFAKTTAAKFIDKYGPVAIECVRMAAIHGGSTGEEKFRYACTCLAAKAPEAGLYLIQTAVQVAYAIYKEETEKNASVVQ